MDIDNLQHKWQNIGKHSDASNDSARKLLDRLSNNRCISTIAKLRRRYISLGVLGLTMPFISLAMNSLGDFSTALLLGYAVYGMVFGLLSFHIASKLSDSGIMSLPVLDSLTKIERINRLRRIYRMLGTVLAVPLLIWLLSEFADVDPIAFWCGVAGAVIGLVINVVVEINLSRQFKSLLDTFRSMA